VTTTAPRRRAPPFGQPLVVLTFSRRIDYRDDEGRPLGEGKVAPVLRAEVPLELRSCPYPGSRHHHPHPMNVSAIRQVRAHLDEAVSHLLVLRRLYFEYHAPAEITFLELWRFGMLPDALPGYLSLRAREPYPSGTFPASLAAMAKLVFGINLITHVLSVRVHLPGSEVPPVTAGAVHALTEQERHLIGPAEVCSAPPALIHEMLECVISGRCPATATESSLPAILGDVPSFLRFAANHANLRTLGVIVHLLRRSHFSDIADLFAVEAAPAAARERFAAAEALARAARDAEVLNVGETSHEEVEALARRVAALEPSARGTVVASLFDRLLAFHDDPGARATTESFRELAELWTAAPEPAVPAIASLLENAPGTAWLGPGTSVAVAAALIVQAKLEQSLLRILSAIEEDLALALGYAAGSLPTGADLENVVGFTARSFFRDALGVSIDSTATGSTIHVGSASLRLTRRGDALPGAVR